MRGQIIDPMFLRLVEALRWVMGETVATSPLPPRGLRRGPWPQMRPRKPRRRVGRGDGEAVPDHAAELAHTCRIQKDRKCLPRRMHRHLEQVPPR